MSIAIFAYIGVEIVAASALEAKWPRNQSTSATGVPQRANDTLIGNTVKFSSIYISILATIGYAVSGLLVSVNTPYNECQLPRLSYLNLSTAKCTNLTSACPDAEDSGCLVPFNSSLVSATSVFVSIAQQAKIPRLSDIFNVFLVVTCLSCANTNIYVASRALFGLTAGLEGGSGQPWHIRVLAWFGRTNRRKVPMRAMVFSAFAFCWVPFLQLTGSTSVDTPTGMVRNPCLI
jgi:yeast amino acid transporter